MVNKYFHFQIFIYILALVIHKTSYGNNKKIFFHTLSIYFWLLNPRKVVINNIYTLSEDNFNKIIFYRWFLLLKYFIDSWSMPLTCYKFRKKRIIIVSDNSSFSVQIKLFQNLPILITYQIIVMFYY